MTSLDELERLYAEASQGEWGVYSEPTTPDDAKRELATLVDGTPEFSGEFVMLSCDGLAPAVTGCGKRSRVNAELIAAMHAALPELIRSARELTALNEAADRLAVDLDALQKARKP